MSTRAIKPKRDDGPLLGGDWQRLRERAPSLMRTDPTALPRMVALASLLFVTVGAASLIFSAANRDYLISPGWGVFFLGLGCLGLVHHAFKEPELQYRRLYGALGMLLLIGGVALRVLPVDNQIGGLFMRYSTPCLLGAWAFLLAFARNETDAFYRTGTVNLLGLVGLASAIAGVIGGWMSERFMLEQGGILHLIFGLLYLATYVGMQETGSPLAYRAGLVIGVLAALMLVAPLWMSILPYILYQVGWTGSPPVDTFMMPRGLLFLYMAIEYGALALGICSDSHIVVLTRRELAAIFYSPIAYVVIVGLSLIGWFQYWMFLDGLLDPRAAGMIMEPIVARFFVQWFPIICLIFMVPVMTMGLLSEEKRTGTLEMLLTAPVNEVAIVVSKFLAVLRFYLLAWLPWGLMMVALRVMGGQEFDYRPALTFFIALAVMGSGFLAMGLFFSSTTRNQIASAVLTFAVMMLWTILFFLKGGLSEESVWHTILTYVSYIDLYINAMSGTLAPRYLLFHISSAILWLFLTVKVLESRKWR
jgi:ABC-2 type transport system permease protein